MGLGLETGGLRLDTSGLELGYFNQNENALIFKVFFNFNLIECPDSQSEILNHLVRGENLGIIPSKVLGGGYSHLYFFSLIFDSKNVSFQANVRASDVCLTV